VRRKKAPHLVWVAHRVPDQSFDCLDIDRLVVALELAAIELDLGAPREIQCVDVRLGEGVVEALVPVAQVGPVVSLKLGRRCTIDPETPGTAYGERYGGVGFGRPAGHLRIVDLHERILSEPFEYGRPGERSVDRHALGRMENNTAGHMRRDLDRDHRALLSSGKRARIRLHASGSLRWRYV